MYGTLDIFKIDTFFQLPVFACPNLFKYKTVVGWCSPP